MKIKEYLPQIIGMSVGVIAPITTLFVLIGRIPETDYCALCGNTIHHTPSKVDPNGWIAENGGGGTLCTTNLGISARLDRIEKSLDALDSDANEIKEITGHGCLFEIYLELGRAVDRNGHRIDALSNRLERLERRTPPSP